MRKLITICLLMATAYTVNAQELNFEETVKYINEIFKENEIFYFKENSKKGDLINGISVKKDGKVVCYNAYKGNNRVSFDEFNEIMYSFNLLDFNRLTYDGGFNFFIKEDSGDVKYLDWGMFSGISESVKNRLNKAFDHLRSFCSKKSDPFQN